MNSPFSTTSQKASSEMAITSRQSADSLGKMTANNPQNRKPWSAWVKVNDPKSPWELSEPHVSPDHRQRFSHELNHTRPWLCSRNAVVDKIMTIMNQGNALLVLLRSIVSPAVRASNKR